MKNNYKWTALLLVLIISIALMLSGCAGVTSGTNQTKAGGRLPAAADLMADVKAQEWPTEAEAPDPIAIGQLNHFADQLLRQAVQNEGNVMISPASVYLALAMTLQGADGDTADAMMKLLAGTDLTLDDLNRTARSLMTSWSENDRGAELSLANAIWFDQEFKARQAFLQANADFYAAAARRLDFKDAKTVGIINQWVSDATREKITEIVDEIDPDVVMYLMNAVYFKADWAQEFEKADTFERPFVAPEGEKNVDFMHRIGAILDISADGASGIALPYKDPDYVFFALMPDDADVSPEQWLLAQPETALFAGIRDRIVSGSESIVSLAMPRFESNYEDSLKDDLSALGMGIAFAPGEANFSMMEESGANNLYIGEVKHKTFIRVDEKGTEAAAVTSVEMRVTSMPGFDKEIVLDRPFIYGIMHLPTGVPMFAGVVEDPSVSAE